MKTSWSNIYSIFSIIVLATLAACSKKDDPVPLGAQTNAVLLAGDAGKSKSWKLVSLSQRVGSNAPQNAQLSACFLDNIYKFTNNASQDYAATEGATSCPGGYPTNIENGTWAFTIDGLLINISVGETYSPYGLFSPEPITDANGNAYNIGYPYPARVTTLTATSLVLTQLETVGSSSYSFVLTFTAI